MRERLAGLSQALMLIPGLSGHETRVRLRLARELEALGLAHRTDRLGNLIATIEGDADAPSVMLFAHMDQLGFVIRRIEPDGFLRVERLGGVPEKTLLAQEMVISVEGADLPAIFASKNHHATAPQEKHRVTPYPELYLDAGFESAAEARAAGVEIGAPVVYAPRALRIGAHRLAGTAIDDRAACAVVIEAARGLLEAPRGPRVHVVFSVQEEFNLRGALPAARALAPDIAIQIDLTMASDTPDMQGVGEVGLGAGAAMSLYSFHGRGTLNGLIPHPALPRLFAETAAAEGLALQRAANAGVLTETSYVQLLHAGVAAIDMGFPIRASHSAREICDLRDLEGLTRLLIAAIGRIGPDFSLDRDDFIT